MIHVTPLSSHGLGFSLSDITGAISTATRALTSASNTACGVVNSAAGTGIAAALAAVAGSGSSITQGVQAAQSACRPPAPMTPIVQQATAQPSAASPIPVGPAPAAPSAAPKTWPYGAYHVRKKNGRFDIYAPAGSVLAGLADTGIEVISGAFGDHLAGTSCVHGACGLGGDTLIAVDEPSPGMTPPRPFYKNPVVVYGAAAAGGVAVLGTVAALLLRRRG